MNRGAAYALRSRTLAWAEGDGHLVDIITNAAAHAASSESSPAAYQRLLPRILAIQEPRTANVDVLSVVLLVMGKLPGIMTLREVGLVEVGQNSTQLLLVARGEPLRDVMYAP